MFSPAEKGCGCFIVVWVSIVFVALIVLAILVAKALSA